MRHAAKFALLLCALTLASACGTARKLQTSERTQAEWDRQIREAVQEQVRVQLDSFRHDVTEISWSRREYYEPTQPDPASDSTTQDAAKKPAAPGPLKSEETLTIRTETQQGTKATTEERRDSAAVQTDTGSLDTQKETKEEPAKDPQRFRYIFYIIVTVAVIGLALFLYFKLKGGGILKKVTSFFRRL